MATVRGAGRTGFPQPSVTISVATDCHAEPTVFGAVEAVFVVEVALPVAAVGQQTATAALGNASLDTEAVPVILAAMGIHGRDASFADATVASGLVPLHASLALVTGAVHADAVLAITA